MHVKIVAHVLFTKYLQIYKSDHPHCDFWNITRLAYMLKKQHENHIIVQCSNELCTEL